MVMARPQYQPVSPAVPADDPLPWLTASWEPSAQAVLPVTEQSQVDAALAAAQKSLNAFVIGLADADQSFRLVLGKSDSVPAATNYNEHTVFVGTKPWSHYADGTLTFGQLVAVFTGLAYHEVGHIVFDRNDGEAMTAWLKSRYADERTRGIANACDNVARDLRLEAGMQQRFPGFAEALHVAMWWVSHHFGSSHSGRPDISDVKGRLAAFVAASRYPWESDWTGLESLRDSWLDWAARAEQASTMSDFQSLVEEGVERILDGAPEIPPAPPKPAEGPTCGPTGDDSEESSESKPGDPDSETGTSDPEGHEDGESESTESDDSEGRGEEPTDDDTEGEGKGDDGDDADESDEPNTEGGDDIEDFSGPTIPDGDDDAGESGDSAEGDDADDADGDESGADMDGDDPGRETKPESSDDDGEESEAKVERGTADDTETGWGDTDVEDIQSEAEMACATKVAADPDDIARQASISSHSKSERTNRSMTFEYIANGKHRRRTIVEARLDRHADEVYGYAGDDGWHRLETTLSAQLPYYNRHSHKGVQKPGYRRTKADTNASRSLAAVMNAARRGPGAPDFGQRAGRIDRRRVGRLAYGETRVFQKPNAAAPQRVKVGILVDASGSMGWGERRPHIEQAAQAARDLAGAVEQLPWATGFVAAHTTGYAGGSSGPVYIPIWQSGEPLIYMDDMLTISMSGNEDGFAVAMTAENVLDSLRNDEKGLVIVISDGAPAYSDGENHTREVVDTYRKRGLRIVSVAISGDLYAETQHAMYGHSDVVEYDRNPAVFAQRVAQVIGSSI